MNRPQILAKPIPSIGGDWCGDTGLWREDPMCPATQKIKNLIRWINWPHICIIDEQCINQKS